MVIRDSISLYNFLEPLSKSVGPDPCLADVHILTYILPRTGCFANDAMTEWGLPRESNRALRAGVSIALDLSRYWTDGCFPDRSGERS